MSEALLIQNFPLPPSENALFATNFKTKRRFPTKDYGLYKEGCRQWGIVNSKYSALFRKMQKENPGKMVKVDVYYVLKYERIFTKDGRPKRLDASNRNKAFQDELSKFLNIDDCTIFNLACEKVSGEKECCVVMISFIKPMTSVDLLNSFSYSNDEPSTIQ